jgi:catechol 2,3-dioxygenase-like lactoylglutathione lyase family enzyme
VNLNQVTIYSNKPAESIGFYQKLGLRLIVDSAPRYVRFECPDGNSTLSIHESADVTQGSNIVLYFECENLDEEVKRLQNLGLTFDSEPIDQDWLWREAHLKDPNGNKIMLFYAGENRLNPPWRIN